MSTLKIGKGFEELIDWLGARGAPVFDVIRTVLTACISGLEQALLLPPAYVIIAVLTVLAWRVAGLGTAAFTALGMLLIQDMGLWTATM
ncbi:MAG: glycine/betaine ABC transporter, partial [Myxococcaceae bacterium]